jgi:hypothetical protein
MNYLAILFVTILSSNALQVENIKFCINCKFFKPKLDNGSDDPEFGKCLKFVRKSEPPITNEYLVTGIVSQPVIKYYFATIARENDHMCGMEAKLYENVFDTQIENDIILTEDII